MGMPWGAPDDIDTFMAMVNNVPAGLDLVGLLDRPQPDALCRARRCSPAAMSASGWRTISGSTRACSPPTRSWSSARVTIVEDMGARVLGPDEVREKLKLTKRAPLAA